MGVIVSILSFREREKFRLCFLPAFLILAFLPHKATAQSNNPTETPQAFQLIQGHEAEREIGGSQKHSYSISLAGDSYSSVKIEQKGADVSARLFNSNGELVAEFDSETRLVGVENVEIVSTAAAVFRLDVETKGKDVAAGKYTITLEEVRPAADRDRSLDEVRRLAVEIRALERTAKYTDAITKTEKAIEILTKTLGANDRSAGSMTNRLGILYYSLGNHARSKTYLRQALAIFESLPVPDDLTIIDPLNNLAVLHRLKGEFVEAEKLWLQVVAIRTRELGEDHSTVASTLNNLGILYRMRGDYAKAEEAYSRALAIRERALGKDHLDVSTVLVNLAALNYYKGDFEAALAIDLRALSIREAKLGPDHPQVAQGRANLAVTYVEMGEFEKAKQLYERAIQSFEQNAGQDRTGISSSEHGIANLYRDRGDYAAARPHYLRSIEMAEKTFSTDPMRVADYLSGYGEMLTLEGKFPVAEAALKRVFEIRERVLGPDHPHVGKACDALARLYSVKGDFEQSLLFQSRANAINETHIARNLMIGTEHQRIAFMSQMSIGMEQTLNLHVLKGAANAEARDLAFTAVLNRKGRVLDAVAYGRSSLTRRLDPDSQLLMQRANDALSRLAESALAGPAKGDVAGFQKQLASMKDSMDELDKEISRRSSGQYEIPATVNIKSIAAELPPASALVEFSIFRPIPKSRRDDKSVAEEARYVAYILTENGAAKWADLGAANEIDEAIRRFRNALRDPKQQNVRNEARNLDQKIMQPVRSISGNVRHFLISPDGDLSHTPFEALVDEGNRFLVERFAFTYLSSGRELLRMKTKRASASPPLVVANPSFGDSPSASDGVATASRSKASRRSITSVRGLSDTYFAPLAATGAEARSIQSLFSDAKVLSGNGATETAVKQAVAPRLLHIATHGFFLQNAHQSNRPGGVSQYRGGMPTNTVENPLLRSGLAFAGANRKSSGTDDGILTALEASGLNLWGTKLVVLSACDTGVGEVRNGEGVYGLRRSFQIAGAESLVMSLWPISDLVTRELMTGYYTNLKKGAGRGESLRRVQLEMLKRPNRRHPFYWASFIQSGEWANLDGKR